MSDFRLIIFQFSFTNAKAVPKNLLCLKNETAKESAKRRSIANGVLFIQPTERCSLEKAVEDLKGNYELTEALYQERFNPKNPKSPYHMVRFVFIKKNFWVKDEEFEKKKAFLFKELLCLCKTSYWRVRGYSNPFFDKEGKQHEEIRAISVNAEVRVPLFYPDGKPIFVWDKDENGNKIGEKPHPIKPTKVFRFNF